jgi:hypothetical protein
MAENLTAAETRLLTAMLEGRGIAAAARSIGMVERTARRWAARPHFQAELQRRTAETLGTTARALAVVMGGAVATAAALMGDATQPPAVRLAAARLILSERAALVNEVDIMRRIDELERALDERR